MSNPLPETQSQRWLKYGGNVALTTLVAILLAAGVQYIVQKQNKRIDTTIAGVNSLRPQSLAIIRNLKGKVRLVSLYPLPSTQGMSGAALDVAKEQIRQTETVTDLLNEYVRASGDKITAQVLDPRRETDKVEALVKEVTQKYGTELKPYEQFLKVDYPKFTEQFKAFVNEQGKAITGIDSAPTTGPAEQPKTNIGELAATMQEFLDDIKDAQDTIDPLLKKSIPDYKAASDRVGEALSKADALLAAVLSAFKQMDDQMPANVRAYAARATPQFEAAQKLVKEQLDKQKALKDLKLDALAKSIASKTILVMGDEEMRVLAYGDVWQMPDDLSGLGTKGNTAPRLKFAGEQQVSTALVSIGRKAKPRVIFVRGGGAPLATSMFSQAPLSYLAARLRGADFEVLEKDLSGQFAQQAMMQGMPAAGEATDEQMRDRSAVWICGSVEPAMGRQGPNPMAGRLKEHLSEGGSALVLSQFNSDNMEPALKDYGISVRTDAVIVKEVAKDLAAPQSGDILAQVQFTPYFFETNKYGDHPLVKPVGGLRMLELAFCPVSFRPQQGVAGAPLLPVTRVIKTWGETDLGFLDRRGPSGASPEFDPGKDVANSEATPMFAGAAAEKGPSRLVALGSMYSFTDQINTMPDPELQARGYLTPRFPGNAELVVDAVFWLSHNDTMLEISPQALEVSRIRDMSEVELAVVRWGILVGLIPGLVLLCGVIVYVKRRE